MKSQIFISITIIFAILFVTPVMADSNITLIIGGQKQTESMGGIPELQFLEKISPNDSYWIRIDPITHHMWGDAFTITARTNLPLDQNLILQGSPDEGIDNMIISHGFTNFEDYGYIRVRCNYTEKESNDNVTSCFINTSFLKFPNLHYSISTKDYTPGNISSFNLSPYWIVIDPIGTHAVGDIIKINGTTNTPAGSNLSFFIPANCYTTPGQHCTIILGQFYSLTHPGISGSNPNIFSFDVNTSGHEPGNYQIIASGLEVKTNYSHFELDELSSSTSQFSSPLPTKSQASPIENSIIFISIPIMFFLIWMRKNP